MNNSQGSGGMDTKFEVANNPVFNMQRTSIKKWPAWQPDQASNWDRFLFVKMCCHNGLVKRTRHLIVTRLLIEVSQYIKQCLVLLIICVSIIYAEFKRGVNVSFEYFLEAWGGKIRVLGFCKKKDCIEKSLKKKNLFCVEFLCLFYAQETLSRLCIACLL